MARKEHYMFANSEKVVEANTYAPRIQKEGFYPNCVGVRVDPAPKDKQDDFACVVVWREPKTGMEITDFIPTNKGKEGELLNNTERYIVSHAIELTQAITGEEVDPNQKLGWADAVYKQVGISKPTVNIRIINGVNRQGQPVKNVRYMLKDGAETAPEAKDEIPF